MRQILACNGNILTPVFRWGQAHASHAGGAGMFSPSRCSTPDTRGGGPVLLSHSSLPPFTLQERNLTLPSSSGGILAALTDGGCSAAPISSCQPHRALESSTDRLGEERGEQSTPGCTCLPCSRRCKMPRAPKLLCSALPSLFFAPLPFPLAVFFFFLPETGIEAVN